MSTMQTVHTAQGALRRSYGSAGRAVRSTCVLGALLAAGCAEYPYQQSSPIYGGTRSADSAAAQSEALRTTQVYVYPGKGQSAEQLDRDRYECYRWAVAQTGFDPSQPSLAPHQRVEVVPAPPPGTDTAAGIVTGAAVGAAVAHRGHQAEGALVGAVIGGLIGSTSDAARISRAQEIQSRYDTRESEHLARLEQQSNDYRRAMTACLEGRGYTVK